MNDELFGKYESELTFIRQLSAEFAKKYPKLAGRVHLRDDGKETQDPHVERLIQSFALLTARIRHKIEDDFPEIVESLINLIYPHYLRPIPPVAIAQFQFNPSQSVPTAADPIPTDTVLHSRSAEGISATFRTTYPVSVWPLKIESTTLSSVSSSNLSDIPAAASSVLRIRLEVLGTNKQSPLTIPFLRFFLNGEDSTIHTLYELIMTHTIQVEVRSTNNSTHAESFSLSDECIFPVGFEPNEGVLPYSARSFTGYRLLQEYFHFPEKFLFFDIRHLESIPFAQLGPSFEILIFLRESELRNRVVAVAPSVRGEILQLGCTPIVNLFKRPAEPIRLSHAVTEYQIVPDRHREAATEVYSIDRVLSTAAFGQQAKEFEPFYSHRHVFGQGQIDDKCFWSARRQPSMRDSGTDVFLSLVDLSFNPKLPPDEVLSVHVTCTNRDFVEQLRWQREWGELEGDLPLFQVRCTVPPKKTLRPPMGGSLQWRLISHLTLNHLSIVQGKGKEALQEILNLYFFADDESVRRRIMSISDVASEAGVGRVSFESGVAFCRGLDIKVVFDEEQFKGSGVYLMASVLERFFALYGTLNSFTRLTALSQQRQQPIQKWEARVGERRLA